jgi:endonuclease/exonuclease/phosphatase family metal-dependent hydrolase
MNKKFKIILITLIVSPLILSLITFGIGEVPREVSPKSELKFMTYNIHFGQGMDDLLNLERIAQNILIDDPDIIGLQEVEVGRITSQGIDMAFWLAKRLGMNYYYSNPEDNEHVMGNTILSKYPIVLSNSYELPSILQERVFIHCVVEISESLSIDVFCTHIGIRTENKLAQIDFLLATIVEISTSSKKVLMGDFNLHNDTLEIAKVLTYFNDTAEEFGAVDRASIDYIFAAGYQNVLDYHVVTDMLVGIDISAEFGSDHLPVVSIIDFS